MSSDWATLQHDITEALQQAQRRLARPTATRSLATIAERLSRQFDATRDYAAHRTADPDPDMLTSLRGWLGDLREQLGRDFVRGDRDAQKSRRERAAFRRGQHVRIRGSDHPDFPNGQSGVIERVVVGRRAKVTLESGARWSLSVDDLEPLD